ncbi:sulfatase family protein [Adhaeretor mobilis]|uniref:Sulfatase n=1 Tax=Adhaeretor mobilis TaxID=1930276 RepID=A0A517MYK6_9BACT|nr:sulfatase [Adhaeretor mobilis]QDS99897.1 Sulfatase [Adhaeretor mobilis]
MRRNPSVPNPIRNAASAALLLFGIALVAGILSESAEAADEKARPNILWITSEDNATQWLGCYGNEQAQTPRLDLLAKRSVLFTNAYSNAPVCAVARSTLLNGAYAVTLGTQNMRSRHRVPHLYKPYVTSLRELGYYCTNRTKTDYNQLGDDKALWDDSTSRAHYKNRPEGAPFFSIFNLTVSHESSLFPEKIAKQRKRGVIPKKTRLDLAGIEVPPYLPDLPEVRSDFAIYHDTITALDREVGELLDELVESGQAENTIVFYYGDHGGPTPRGKRYLNDTGVKVPLLIHVPEKFKSLSPFVNGESIDELVSFVDFAPTLFSLVGNETPEQMQGRPFLGPHRREPRENDSVFLYADRFDEIIGMRRGLTDGRFKYIRRFTPQLPAAPYSNFQFSMPSWVAWRKAWQEGKLEQRFSAIWESPQPVELLFDTLADPWEINNLACDSAYAEKLQSMRERLRTTMRDVRDTGLIPESLFESLSGERTINEFASSGKFNLDEVLGIAFVASERNPNNLPVLKAALTDTDPLKRYWGAQGCAILGDAAANAVPVLQSLLDDQHAGVRVAAACALLAVGETDQRKQVLLAELDKPLNDEAAIQLMNALVGINALSEVPALWVQRTLRDKQANDYLKRFANRVKLSREETVDN